MEKPVQSFNFFYWFFRPLVCFGAISHYRTFSVRGKDKLPKEGGYMLAPCHQQALMEPLAVLSIVKKSPVFLARADIFNNPTIRKALLFLKIMPVYRIRDGFDSLNKNTEIFEKSSSVVLDGFPFCMMAEGTHNNKHQLLPLVKGMFRIAGGTQSVLGKTPLYIVPMGINFDEYEEPYSNLCVNIGEPIPVQQFMTTFVENEPIALNQMRNVVSDAMKEQMLNIQSKDHYEEIHTLTQVLNKDERKKQKMHNTAFNRFLARKSIAKQLDMMEQHNDTLFEPLMQKTREYMDLCKKVRVTPLVQATEWNPFKIFGSIFLLWLVVVACVMNINVLWGMLFCLACYPIILIPTHKLVPRFIKDPQFRSSVNFAIRFFPSILYTIIFSLIMGFTHGGSWGQLLPGISGFWWWLAAFNIPFLMAYISGPLVSWLRNLWKNIHYSNRMYWHRKEYLRLAELLNEIRATLYK